MGVGYQIVKVSATGEQLTATVIQHNPVTGEQQHTDDEMEELFNNAISMLDERMIAMNMRMLEASQLQPYCHPSIWAKVQQVMEVLCGRLDVQVLKARWQSEIEETADLEAERANNLAKLQRAMVEDAQRTQQQLNDDGLDVLRQALADKEYAYQARLENSEY